ncbi:MAG: amidohydrolase family protein [Myxococcota bacterium]
MAMLLGDLRIWDGESNAALPAPSALRVEGQRIVDIGPQAALADGAETLSFPGCTAIPGLIDGHVHLVLDPEIVDPLEQVVAPAAQRLRSMEARAEAMLRAGITTARDLGGGEGLELALRERIASGEVPGPRLLCAGQPLTSRGGHCHFWGGEASSDEEIVSVVRRQLANAVDWVKVMATGGVMTKASDPFAAQFDERQLRLVVATAAAGGRSVAAHCHGTPGIENAARAGVASIEHCSFAGPGGFGRDLQPEVVAAVAEAGTWVSPTINLGWGRRLRAAAGDGEGHEAAARFVLQMRKVLAALRQAGVPLVASTDAGIPRVPHDRLAEGLAAFAELAELTPVEALRTATSTAADALGIGPEMGRLRPGAVADILIVEGDPLRDLEALRRPRWVLARGRLFEARR